MFVIYVGFEDTGESGWIDKANGELTDSEGLAMTFVSFDEAFQYCREIYELLAGAKRLTIEQLD
jgi:hypothetical protein